jgi:hypothetical protein
MTRYLLAYAAALILCAAFGAALIGIDRLADVLR